MMPNSVTKTIIALLMIMALMSEIAAQEEQQSPGSNKFEYRDSIAPYKSISEIFDNPVKIESHIKSVKIDGVDVLDTLFDFHAVYEIPISKLLDKVIDLENEQNVFPRVIYTRDLNPDDSLWAPHLQEVKTSFKYGGFGQDYHFIFYTVPELRNDGSFLIKWNLYESIDGKFNFDFGSWYMKELICDGQKFTYVRNYIHYGIVNYPLYVKVISKLAGESDIKRFFKALQIAAE